MVESNRRSRLFCLVPLCAVLVLQSGHLRGGENIETTTNGGANIIDGRWDRRFYDGTAGWDGFVKWYHNPTGIPGAVTQTNFQNAVQAGFDTWNAVDNA